MKAPLRSTIFKKLEEPVKRRYYAVVVMFDEEPLYSLHSSSYRAYSAANDFNALYRINVRPCAQA